MTTAETTKKKRKKNESIVKKPARQTDQRKRKKPEYKSFRLQKRVKHIGPPLPSWWGITKKAIRLLKANARQLAWFTFVYGLLYVVFVRGFASPVDVDGIRASFEDVAGDDLSTFATNFTVFSLMVDATTNAAGEVSSLYQIIFLLISSLALIWLFRQQQAGNKVSMKDAFYRGMYPLIPFILVATVIGLQTLPASIGNFLFTLVLESGVAVNTYEQVLWFILLLFAILLSFYLITSSIVALFLVTLPEMTPMASIRKAKELVKHRRWSVLRKMFAVAIFVLLMFVGIVFPLLFVSALAAQIVFFVLTMLTVPFVVAYMFVLYRELL